MTHVLLAQGRQLVVSRWQVRLDPTLSHPGGIVYAWHILVQNMLQGPKNSERKSMTAPRVPRVDALLALCC